jgi:uncharacterized membrane protein YdcZ (DUF606 family)
MNYLYTSMVFFVGFMLPAQVGINARLGMGGVLIGSAVVLGPIIAGPKIGAFALVGILLWVN